MDLTGAVPMLLQHLAETTLERDALRAANTALVTELGEIRADVERLKAAKRQSPRKQAAG